MTSYLLLTLFFFFFFFTFVGSEHSNTDERSVKTTWVTMLKNRSLLVTFYESILISFRTFVSALVYMYIYIYIYIDEQIGIFLVLFFLLFSTSFDLWSALGEKFLRNIFFS